MQLIRLFMFVAVLGAFSTFAVSCSNGSSKESEAESSEVPHGEGMEYNSAYVCPMHCDGSGSEEAGKCPVCGMDYIAQSEHAKDGHNH